MLWEDYLALHANQQEQTDFLPKEWLDKHTMRGALDAYVRQKLVSEQVTYSMRNNRPMEAHGIYPMHATAVLTGFGYGNFESLGWKGNKDKEYNFVRPHAYYADHQAKRKFVSNVIPGHDYLSNHGEMLRHYVRMMGANPDELVKVFHYPDVNSRIADWTGLDDRFVQSGDRVVIGYVNEMEERLSKQASLRSLNRTDKGEQNDYYGSRRYQTTLGYNLNFLGVKYSFWGDSSANLVNRMCELGASEVIYTAKTGSLTAPDDLYKKLYCPGDFINMNRDDITSRVTLPNGLVLNFPSLNSGSQVTIPTVMEESFMQREIAYQNGARSIDNETGQMARMIQLFNKLHGKNVRFSTMHFGTDYLHTEFGDEYREELINLSTDRATIKPLKEAVLDQVAHHLGEYLFNPRPAGRLNAPRLAL